MQTNISKLEKQSNRWVMALGFQFIYFPLMTYSGAILGRPVFGWREVPIYALMTICLIWLIVHERKLHKVNPPIEKIAANQSSV